MEIATSLDSAGEANGAVGTHAHVVGKSQQASSLEAADVIDALDIHTYLDSDANYNATPTGRMRKARQLVLGCLPGGARLQRRDMSENDAVLVEIYGSMVRRVISLLSEWKNETEADAVKLRRIREVTCNLDETPANTGGLPIGREVYARKSMCEFGGLLTSYYSKVSHSEGKRLHGPATIIMDV